MEWLRLLKECGFTHWSETPNDVVYSKQLQKGLIEKFMSEFSAVWGTGFSLHLDEEPILSLPSEITLLANTIDLCNNTVDVKIELKKSGMVPRTIINEFNVHIFSQADPLIQSLRNLSFTKLEQWVFKKISQPAYIIIYDQEEYSTSVFNDFITIGDISILNKPFEDLEKKFKIIQDKIKERNENIRWNHETSFLSPDVYYFKDGSTNAVSELFNKIAAMMCVAFTALNTDYSDEEENYSSTFFGLKQTKFRLVMPDICEKENIDKIYSLYDWAYSEKTTDKIGLIQNIINLHIKEENNQSLDSLLKNIYEILEMVKENYRVYIQKSVKSYLDERKQVEEFIRTTSNEISKQITGLTDIVTKNLFGLLATAITAVIGFNKPENQAYIPWILYVYSFFSISLTIYYSTLANTNKKAIFEVYDKRLVDYKKIFLEDRIDNITGNIIQKQTIIFRRYLHWTVWPSIAISLVACFVGLKFHGVFTWVYIKLLLIIDIITKLFI